MDEEEMEGLVFVVGHIRPRLERVRQVSFIV